MQRVRTERRLRAKDLSDLPEGKHEDGGGLRLVVERGSRRWVLRTTIAGKRREFGLGGYPLVPLEDARDRATAIRRAGRDGRDLVAEERRTSTTFSDVFEDHFKHRLKGMKNAKHIWQWLATVESHAIPIIGARPIAEIGHDEIIDILDPIWRKTPETARRLLQRLEIMFQLAIRRGLRERASPCTGIADDLGKQGDSVEHYRALPYAEVPGFIQKLRICNSRPTTKLAFEWLILTAARPGEVRGATKPELQGDLWVIPKARMKAGVEHVVPLSARCQEIVRAAAAVAPGGLLFPSQTGKPLSDMTFTKLLRDNDLADRASAHGFRSSFKDWAAEVAKARDEVSEAALAHRVPNKVKAAYPRAQFLEERRQLMEDWAAHCGGDWNPRNSHVVIDPVASPSRFSP